MTDIFVAALVQSSLSKCPGEMWWHTPRGLPGPGPDGRSTGASALHKSIGDGSAAGALGGRQEGAAGGCSREGKVLSVPQFPS